MTFYKKKIYDLINLKCLLFLLPVLIPFGLPVLLQLLEQAQETWWIAAVHMLMQTRAN